MMRKLIVMAMVAGMVGFGARYASAGATVDLLFVGHNGAPIAATNTVTAGAGDTLTMAVRFTNDQVLTASVFSLNYDLDGKSELTATSAVQWIGVSLLKSAAQHYKPIGP